jgi:hypothetical protein
MMLLPFVFIAWSVCIYGVYGNIGPKMGEREENALVMELYTIH